MRRIFFFILFAGLVMAGSAHAGTDAAAAPLTLDTRWSVSLDASGHVIDVKQKSQAKPPIADPLATAIRSWEFKPGSLNGDPAATETTLRVRVRLEPRGDDAFVVRVDRVGTGGDLDKTDAPVFPISVVKAHTGGFAATVVVEAHYDEAGNVVSVAPAPGTTKVDPSLTRSALKAVKGWTFAPERVAGHGVAATAYVPVCYWLAGNPRIRDDCRWLPPGEGEEIGSGMAFVPNPSATLVSDVIGQAL